MVFDQSVFSSRPYLNTCSDRRRAENQEKWQNTSISNLHGFTSAPAVMFHSVFPPGKEEMGWHPTIFSTLCLITSKLALHGNKLSPKASKTFPHSTVSFLPTRDCVILNTNLLPLHQFLNIYGETHRHKTGFPITPTFHAALNLGQDVTLAEPQPTIYLNHFHMGKLGF